MEIRIEQSCPQCGGPVVLSESDRLLTCSYCGVRNFLRSRGLFRYVLPVAGREEMVHAPYLRFKGTIFLVREDGIEHRLVDTTQVAVDHAGLPPSLGLRPQAMRLGRLAAATGGRFLRPAIRATAVLEKAARLSTLLRQERAVLYHRAFIGETVSCIYLPLQQRRDGLFDAVQDRLLVKGRARGLEGFPFSPRWQVDFLPTLCPHCGWTLDGEGDCLLLTCGNCDRAWLVDNSGLQPVPWQVVAGDERTRLYIGFWRITARIPTLAMESFADFIELTNQPMLPRPEWQRRAMQFWIPAFRIRPRIFLRLGRQATIGQHRLRPEPGTVRPGLYPVTLPPTEARQAIKVILAASAASPKRIFPSLPGVRPAGLSFALVYLPFVSTGQEWLQPHTGMVINKRVLGFGRSL